MPILIGLLLAVELSIDVFQLDLSLGPGLSLKNAMLYLVAGMIVVRMVARRDARFELRSLQIAFQLLILYAIVTWLIAWKVVQYDNYPGAENGFYIKGVLADFYIFFLVCFYGLRTRDEAITALTALLLATSAANLVTIAEVTGLTHFGIIEVRDNGRVQGALGEANQYAGFLAFCIPLYAASAYVTRGLWRAVWAGCAVLAVLAMLTTVSRGGFAALLGAAVIGCFMFKRYIAVGKLAAWSAIAATVAIIVLFASSGTMRSLITDRLFNETRQADFNSATNGRQDIWVAMIQLMLDHPITLVTGYGWRVYWSMPVLYSPHNTYLNYWFNLGLPGLTCLLVMLGTLFVTARDVARNTSDETVRFLLIGFVFGMISIFISIFFVELYVPWIYLWACFGIIMRLALAAPPAALPAGGNTQMTPTAARGNNPYGWAGAGKPAATARLHTAAPRH